MDQSNMPAPKIVDFNTAPRHHFDKCTAVKVYDNTLIMLFAQLESLQDAPGAPVEEVLLVRQHSSLTFDGGRELYELLHGIYHKADAGHG